LKLWPLVVALAFFALVSVAFQCEEGISVYFINNTSSPVTIYFDNQPTIPSVAIPPGETRSAGTVIDEWPSTITAKDLAGKVVFSHRYTWDEINQAGGRIIIGCTRRRPPQRLAPRPPPLPHADDSLGVKCPYALSSLNCARPNSSDLLAKTVPA
jgi:hypothetical protein